MKEQIIVHDKRFSMYLSSDKIQSRIREIALELRSILNHKNPIFLPVLNGAFMFAADLMKHVDYQCEIQFIKAASYSGMESTGTIAMPVGLPPEIKDRHIVIVEDIIDTGRTLSHIQALIKAEQPASLHTVSLLYKPDNVVTEVEADFIGFKIPDKFVVGYGLDYDNLGRHLSGIYQLAE